MLFLPMFFLIEIVLLFVCSTRKCMSLEPIEFNLCRSNVISSLRCESYSYHSSCLKSTIGLWAEEYLSPCACCCLSYFLGAHGVYKLASNSSAVGNQPLQGRNFILSAENLQTIFSIRHDAKITRHTIKGRIESRYEHIPSPRVLLISNINELTTALYFSSSTGQSFYFISTYQSTADADLLSQSFKLLVAADVRDRVLGWYWSFSAKEPIPKNLFSSSYSNCHIIGGGIRAQFSQPNPMEIRVANIANRNVTVSCYSRGDLANNRNMREQCISFLGVDQCDRCKFIPDMQPLPSPSYSTALRISRFVVVLPVFQERNAAFKCDLVADTLLGSWVAEAILSGCIPILDSTCKLELEKRGGHDQAFDRLPIFWTSFKGEYLTTERLLAVHADILTRRDEFDVAPLFLPFWVHKMANFPVLDAHIARGRTRYHNFMSSTIPRISDILFGDSTTSQGRRSESEAVRKACGNQDNKKFAAAARTVDIVLPRCCESAEGDLRWVKQLVLRSQSKRLHRSGLQLRFFVYYKCPWCLPASLLANFTAASSPPRDRLIRQHGGVHILDEIALQSANQSESAISVQEYSAFDIEGPNAKEATAYLMHLTNRYNSLAQYTIFTHSQPAHHLSCERFIRLFEFLSRCGPLPAAASYMSLNYRWFEGTWAHQPEKCSKSLLEHLFGEQSSGYKGPLLAEDKSRVPFLKKDLKAFIAEPMASGTAAQFVVSKEAILARPLDFWSELQALNNGSRRIPRCLSSSQGWSEVASAMERLWHTFFRHSVGNIEDFGAVFRPLYAPDVPYQYELPPFLRETSSNGCTEDGDRESNLAGPSQVGSNTLNKSPRIRINPQRRQRIPA